MPLHVTAETRSYSLSRSVLRRSVRYRTFIGPSAVQKSSLVAWPEARALLAKGPAKVAAALSAVDVTRVPQINLVALWKYIAHEDWPAPAFAARPALSLLRAFVVARRTLSPERSRTF